MNKKVFRTVTDLAMGAYVKMHGYKCVGRKNRSFFFEMNEDDSSQFEQLKLDYINSQFHAFDSEIMALKKIGEYVSVCE
jgi:hypothetical protein